MRFTAVQEQPEIPKHEAFCEIHREMYCLGCNTHSFGMCTPCPAPPCTALHPSALRTGHGQLLYLQAPWGHDDGLWPRL